MLTNQLIGAAHNAQNHSPRQAASPDQAVPAVTPPLPTNAAPDGETPSAIKAAERADDIRPGQEDRPPLEIPKRVEMRVAVIDSIPDAVPESIYDAKAIPEPEQDDDLRKPPE
jgi:hypothetical protein